MANYLKSLVYGLITLAVVFISINQQMNHIIKKHELEVQQWIAHSEHKSASKLMHRYGCQTLLDCVNAIHSLERHSDPSDEKSEPVLTLIRLATQLKNRKILHKWLKNNNIPNHYIEIIETKYNSKSLQELSALHWSQTNNEFIDEINGNSLLKNAFDSLPNDENGLESLCEDIWLDITGNDRKPWNWEQTVITSLTIAIAVSLITMATNIQKSGFLSYVTGNYLAPQNSRVKFEWTDPAVVGNTMSFMVKFFQRNGRPYPISAEDNVRVEISQGSHIIPSSTELGGSDPRTANTARVQFTAKRSGAYSICILIGPNPTHIRGSPFTNIYFLPTLPSPQETGFINHCSTVVCTEKTPHALFIEMRDKYENLCPISPNFDPSDDFSVDLIEMSTEKPIHSAFYWEIQPNYSRIALVLKLDTEGLYSAIVSYRGSVLKNGEFNIIVLNSSDSALVQKHSSKKSQTSGFNARLLSLNNERLNKPKKVVCFVSPKQLTIKEYILKIIPKRVVTFRLCPSTKFQFSRPVNQMPSEDNTEITNQILVIDDGCQPPVELLSEDRNVIAATFTAHLLNNIGGSETFKDKQDFFYSEVRKYHQKSFHERYPVRIDRQRLVESSIKATKHMSVSDWCKNFEIQFVNEVGVDWGGLRKEWFELLSTNLFDPDHSDLFHRFKNDRQGLVHPNPRSKLKPKYYEFAGRIVGKCLYESSLGSTYRQLLRARFSRSFLAQLIGLRVHYKYFERDDPDLYVSKIKYILENDVEDMELMFTEDEYDTSSGRLIRTAELIPNGAKTKVTNANKLHYLDALAQYRLSTSVKDQVEAFLKGLNDLIPDNLLCIFDENELELLVCGAGNYSIAEFKANHAVSSGNYEFRKILDWFWTAVSNFTDEEMARLLQFTTGCSQLPPGGFAELNPKFHIMSAPTFGVLPTAHTCFNQLCLPEYDSYDQFERALRLAINEGAEGFGMI